MATKGKKISEVALDYKLTELDGSELVPMAKNGSNAVADTNTIKEFAQVGLDDKYVEKEDGKGLSSNDFTDEDKAKLDRFELVLANDDEIEDGLHQIASSEDYRSKLKENGYVVYHDVKFKVKDCGVTSDSFPWIVTEGAIITANEEGELSDHTQKNVARSVYIWFDTILHYQPYGSFIPSKVSELTNDLKYTTETQVENRLAILYESLDSQLVDEYTHLDNKKVDKVEGKQLSTEDFTTLLKQKLEGLTNYDDSTLTSELNALKSRLDTLVGSGDVTAVIDTFQEIENFLQGVTNTQTLTGLLQEMKSEIVALCADTYIPKPSNGTSSQFLKADGSVDDTAYLPNKGGIVYAKNNVESSITYSINEENKSTIGYSMTTGTFMYDKGSNSNLRIKDGIPMFNSSKIWYSGNDGSGSGLDADLLDGIEGSNFTQRTNVIEIPTNGIIQVSSLPHNILISSRHIVYNYSGLIWVSTYTMGQSVRTQCKVIYNNGISVFINGSGSNATLYIKNNLSDKPCFVTIASLDGNCVAYNSVSEIPEDATRLDNINGNILASLSSNVASSDRLTTKQLTNEDLDDIKDSFAVYYGVGGNQVVNKPENVSAFSLMVLKGGSNQLVQILHANESPYPIATYKRVYANSSWLPWKKMLTEDDIAGLIDRIEALESQLNG